MGVGTGVWVHDVLGGQHIYQGGAVRVAIGRESVQAPEGRGHGVGDGELRRKGRSAYKKAGEKNLQCFRRPSFFGIMFRQKSCSVGEVLERIIRNFINY